VGWITNVNQRFREREDLKQQKDLLKAKQCAVRQQLIQIVSMSPRPFPFPYRIKFRELLDISDELVTLERKIARRKLLWLLTGKL